MRVSDRRRMLFAAALTAVAVPAVWLLDDAGDDAAPAEAAATTQAVLPLSTDPPIPVFLDNGAPVAAPAIIDIAVPEGPSSREARAQATFKRYVDPPVERPCTTTLAPPGVTLTVTNVDNGLSTTCTNTRSTSIPPGADLVIDTDVYVVIAELVEAPVPVRITW